MFGLNDGMFPSMIMAFGIAFGGAIVINLAAALFKAKIKREWSAGLVLSVLIFSPFLEELIFRGPVYAVARGEFSTWAWAIIVISAIIFGLIHGIIPRGTREKYYKELNGAGIMKMIVNFTFAGLVLGWLVVTTNSLASAMIVHFVCNLVSLCLTGVERSLKHI